MNFAKIEHSWEGPPQCEYCEIRNIAIFSALQAPDFALIHEPIYEHGFVKGEVLYQVDEPGHYLFTVREGCIKLMDYAAKDGERIVRLLRPGDVAGLEALVSPTYQHNAVALDTTLTCCIPVSMVKELGEKLPDLHYQLLSRWQRAVSEADAGLTELGTGTVKARVARLLIRLAEKEPGNNCFIPTREDIGAMLGVSTEAVSRATAEFKRAGLLKDICRNRANVSIDGIRPFIE